MGIVPIWGFQLAVAIPLAFLFRLNKAIVILAAHISIPPMIPLILFASHMTGALWLGEHASYLPFSRDINFEMLGQSLLQYVSGAITLALIAGLVSGLVTLWLLKSRKNSKAA